MERERYAPVARRRSGIGRILTILLLLVILGLGGCFYWKYYFTYSSGKRYGLLQKFSHKGSLFKTFEGEMILSSIRSNTNVPLASEKFLFSVKDKKVANQLMDLQGRYVTVHYKEKNAPLSWRGDSRYIVDSVQVEQ
ncbi:MAG: hypothetical protein M3342_18145 [Bacteroidota bacterium]|nr:hypothetical protein [Flavisolibacter sp.]MBD0376512.1 hypothetical protein [Flavisolibacter sp.]MDQ3845909.1 hypothetical protein [Bacteroidota bacterium]